MTHQSNGESRIAAIQEIRYALGCGLRASADFYDRNPSDWEVRLGSAKEEVRISGRYYESPEQKVRDVIKNIYWAELDKLSRGEMADVDVAAFRTIREIETIFGIARPV